MAFIDSLIGYLSPSAGYRRLKYRAGIEALELSRSYQGATKGRRWGDRKAPPTSAKAEISRDLKELRNRSRELVRNNAHAAKGVEVIANNLVGKGIMPAFKTSADDGNDQRRDVLASLWRSWAGSTDCDFDGTLTYSGIQKLTGRAVPESGEILIRRRRVNNGVIPLKLQILESDFLVLDDSLTATADGSYICQGKEYNGSGELVAYHLYEEHPGNVNYFGTGVKTVRVPAEDIAHVFRIDRPGQIRGVPWLAPVMLRLKDFDEFEDAQLVRQKIAACFAAFVHDITSSDDDVDDEDLDISKFEPGIIEMLPPGKTVTLANPPGVTDYKEYSTTQLQAIAAGLGISYEALTGDLSEVNFSSARMGWLEFGRNLDSWRELMINPMLNQKVLRWFKEAALLVGVDAQGLEATWTAPKREMIDPTREVPAKINAIRGGLVTLSEAIREQGKNPDDHLEEFSKDLQKLDSLDIILDSDPRHTDKAGDAKAESSDDSE